MENLILSPSEFTPKVNFLAEQMHLEISGISRPEDVAGFYDELLRWLARFEENLLKKAEFKYENETLLVEFKMSYFNSASSKYFIQILRHIRNLIDRGVESRINWYYEEGDEKMMEDGEDLAEAVELDFSYLEMED